MLADQLEDEATLRLIGAGLKLEFETLEGRVLLSGVDQPFAEDGEQCLEVWSVHASPALRIHLLYSGTCRPTPWGSWQHCLWCRGKSGT